MQNITDDINTVDMVLIDPPYGIMSGISKQTKHQSHEWDEELNPNILLNQIATVLRYKGKAVIFSAEPYTSELIKTNNQYLEFNQKATWLKSQAGVAMMADYALTKVTEDILIYTKTHADDHFPDLRQYADNILNYIYQNNKNINNKADIFRSIGNYKTQHFFTDGVQFSIPSRHGYKELINEFNLVNYKNFKTFNEIKKMKMRYEKNKYENVFNLINKNQETNIFKYDKPKGKKQYDHPTQKPVPLLKHLIKIYSHDGDTVADIAMGSGSTGVACQKSNRNFIGCEPSDEYYNIALKRLKN